jgi:ribose 5-phosphate isomerase B
MAAWTPAQRSGYNLHLKRVIATQDIPQGGEFRIPLGSIVTPAAREAAEARGVRIVELPADQIIAAVVPERIVAIGADHGGFRLKQTLKPIIESLGFETRDVGVQEEKPADYPDLALAVAELVASRAAIRGVVIDGSGIGSSIAANKVPGIRAALCYDKASARNSREHNDSNVLTLGARLLTETQAEDVLRTWIAAPFAGGRHQARVQKILEIERRYLKQAPCPRLNSIT